jgi:hypothetical protein
VAESLPARYRRFCFEESRQFLIYTHNKTLSVIAMCIRNPDRSPAMISQYFTRGGIVPLLLLQGCRRMVEIPYIRRNILRFGLAL